MSDVDPALASALKRLGGGRNKRVPYVQQVEAADCGAACLAMVLAYHGKAVSLDRVRAAAGTNRGTDALGIVRAAEQFGVRGRGVQVDIGELRHLSRGAILHWGFNHFVVLERVRRNAADIVDPAAGRRRIPIDKLRRYFTGVALLFEPAECWNFAAVDLPTCAFGLTRVTLH